jgi:hypothetical protein
MAPMTARVPTTAERAPTTSPGRPRLQLVAAALAGAIALLYGLLYLGVLSIAGATDGERGILGVAAGLFVVLGALLWWRRSRVLWGAITAIQVLMGWMYVAIAPDRDPSFEVWGLTIRVVSVGLLFAVLKLWHDTRRAEPGDAS